MKPLPLESRTKNLRSRRQPERCRYCADAGMVVVQQRSETWTRPVKVRGGKSEMKTTSALVDEMGPCPFCERGYYEEFGDPESQKVAPVKPPWGDQGFWQGRDIDELHPVITDDRPVPPPLEVKEWLARVTAGVKSP